MGERGKIVTAIARAVAEYGYSQLTLEQVLSDAAVSAEGFEAQFDSLEQGLIAAQDDFLQRLRLEVASACEVDRPWPDQVRAALDAALSYLADAHALARGFVVEATAASLVASERQFAALEDFTELLREGRRLYPEAAGMPASTERALIGGIASIVCDRLLAEEHQALARLEPQFAEFLLVPYLGRAEASRFARN